MKCPNCGNEMINTIGGCYHCDNCGYSEHDLVYRYTKIPSQTTGELKENELIVGDPYVGRSGSTSAPTARGYQIHSPEIKGFLFVEDGSIDVDSLEENIRGSGIEIVVYREGAPMPKLVLIDKEENK